MSRSLSIRKSCRPDYGLFYFYSQSPRALAKLEVADQKSEPSLQALSVLKLVDLICHLWQQYVSTALLPLATSSVTVRREMVIFNNQTISRIEGTANTLMNRLIDGKPFSCCDSILLSLFDL